MARSSLLLFFASLLILYRLSLLRPDCHSGHGHDPLAFLLFNRYCLETSPTSLLLSIRPTNALFISLRPPSLTKKVPDPAPLPRGRAGRRFRHEGGIHRLSRGYHSDQSIWARSSLVTCSFVMWGGRKRGEKENRDGRRRGGGRYRITHCRFLFPPPPLRRPACPYEGEDDSGGACFRI